jgi:hypothetical protein
MTKLGVSLNFCAQYPLPEKKKAAAFKAGCLIMMAFSTIQKKSIWVIVISKFVITFAVQKINQ